MTSFKFVKSLRERMLTLLCLGFVVVAGTSLASRSDAQAVADGKATIQWNITGFGWVLGAATDPDGGTNYSSGVSYSFSNASPWTIEATVYWPYGLTDWSFGNATIVQPFILVPYTGAYPDLSYTVTDTALAYIGDAVQYADANAYTVGSPFPGQIFSDGAQATASDNTVWYQYDPQPVIVTWRGLPSGYTETGTLFAEAFQPFPVGSGLGCTYKSPFLNRKTSVGTHIPNRNAIP